jgi:hypothetical protein
MESVTWFMLALHELAGAECATAEEIQNGIANNGDS